MNNGLRIPTVPAILLVGGLVALLSMFSDDARILLGRAATPSGTVPTSVDIFNITDTSAVVYWESTDVVASTLVIPSSSTTVYDVRDTDLLAKPYLHHIYTVHNLPPNKDSSFEIKIGSQTVYKGTITTGPPLSDIPQALPLYGTVPKDIVTRDVIIKADINNEVTALIYSSNPSNWVIPLSSLRTTDLQRYYCSSDKCIASMPVTFTFITEREKVQKTTTLSGARPYSEDEENESVLSATIEESTAKKILPTRTAKISISPTKTISKIVLDTTKNNEIEIINPIDGQALSFTKPHIRGTGVAGRNVTITISGQITQIGKTTVTEKSAWQWNPAYPLSPGKYTVKIETTDKNNKKIALTNTFTILKSGENVLSSSTPSATLIPFPTDTPIPPVIPVDIPTATPTIFVTAGPEISLFFIGGGMLLLLFTLALL